MRAVRSVGSCFFFGVLFLVLACSPASTGVPSITPEELARRIESDAAPVVLDVRTPDEFAAGHIPGAINIPHSELEQRLAEIPGSKHDEIVVHCKSGRRAEAAATVLSAAGYTVVVDLEGHMQAWQGGGHPLE